MQQQTTIPQELDKPARFLMFSLREFIALILFFFAGILSSQFLLTVAAGFLCIFLFRKAGGRLKGLSPLALSYWWFGVPNIQSLPASWKRHWRG